MSLGRIDLLNPLNDRHPLATGLAGFWLPLPNMTGGTRLFDLCNRRNDGTLAGGPTWAAGANGFGAVQFDESDDYVLASAPAVTSAAGVAALIYPTATGAGFGTVIFAHDPAANGGYRLAYDSSNRLQLTFGTVADYVFTSLTLTLNAWNFVGVGFASGGTATGYLSTGGAVATQTLSVGSVSGTPTQVVIGNLTWYSLPFAGRIGPVAWHSRQPNDGEFVALHDQFRRGFPDLLRRSRRRGVGYLAAAGGGGGFNPAWAAGANVVIGGAF